MAFGPFAGNMLAGIAALMIGKMLGFGQGGKGLQLPGTGRGLQLPGTGRGLQLPGTRQGKEKKERRNYVGQSSSFEILTNSNWLKPLSNFDIKGFEMH